MKAGKQLLAGKEPGRSRAGAVGWGGACAAWPRGALPTARRPGTSRLEGDRAQLAAALPHRLPCFCWQARHGSGAAGRAGLPAQAAPPSALSTGTADSSTLGPTF